MPIDLSHTPDLILKLYIFITFYANYFPYDRQTGTQSSKSNGKNNKIVYCFLIICRYVNLVKNQSREYLFSK